MDLLVIALLSGAGLTGYLTWQYHKNPDDGFFAPVKRWIAALADWLGYDDSLSPAEPPAQVGPRRIPGMARIGTPADATGGERPPARKVPPPPPDELPPPELGAPTGAPSAGGAQSDLLYAIDALVAEASHGDIRAVRRVIGTLAQAADGKGSALRRLGTRLAEPDKDYGPEIYEKVLAAGAHVRAAGMVLAEADAQALALLHKTLNELADSPQRAPHNSQMNGGA